MAAKRKKKRSLYKPKKKAEGKPKALTKRKSQVPECNVKDKWILTDLVDDKRIFVTITGEFTPWSPSIQLFDSAGEATDMLGKLCGDSTGRYDLVEVKRAKEFFAPHYTVSDGKLTASFAPKDQALTHKRAIRDYVTTIKQGIAKVRKQAKTAASAAALLDRQLLKFKAKYA